MADQVVDEFFADGCGRCKRYKTPDCSVRVWNEAIVALRAVLRASPLTEEHKWQHPCYTRDGRNIAIIGAFRDHCVLTFFKGALLSDPANILELPGENSQSGRVIRFRSSKEVADLSTTVLAYIDNAIEVETSGQQVEKIKIEDRLIPDELASKFEEMPELKEAFKALTPGRQRFYLMQFSQPKQAKTREARIEKSIDNIMAGKGFGEL